MVYWSFFFSTSACRLSACIICDGEKEGISIIFSCSSSSWPFSVTYDRPGPESISSNFDLSWTSGYCCSYFLAFLICFLVGGISGCYCNYFSTSISTSAGFRSYPSLLSSSISAGMRSDWSLLSSNEPWALAWAFVIGLLLGSSLVSSSILGSSSFCFMTAGISRIVISFTAFFFYYFLFRWPLLPAEPFSYKAYGPRLLWNISSSI